jgi:hypothetical protein
MEIYALNFTRTSFCLAQTKVLPGKTNGSLQSSYYTTVRCIILMKINLRADTNFQLGIETAFLPKAD